MISLYVGRETLLYEGQEVIGGYKDDGYDYEQSTHGYR